MLVGDDTATFISGLNIHKAFISTTALHLEFGLSIYTGDLVPLKKAMISASQQVYGVVDHHKFGQFALRTFANCSELDCIISDHQLDEDTAALYSQNGVKVDYQS